MDTVTRFFTVVLALTLCFLFVLFYAQQKEACRYCGGSGGGLAVGENKKMQCGCIKSQFTSWIQSTVIQRCTVTAKANETIRLLEHGTRDWETSGGRRRDVNRDTCRDPQQESQVPPSRKGFTAMKGNLATTTAAGQPEIVQRVTVIERQESPLKLFCSLAYFTFSVWRITGVLF